MIVLIMAGAGLLVVENATMKIHTLGSFRVSKQGYYLAETGLTSLAAFCGAVGPTSCDGSIRNWTRPLSLDECDFPEEGKDKERKYAFALANDKFSETMLQTEHGNELLGSYGADDWGSFGPEFRDTAKTSFLLKIREGECVARVGDDLTLGLCRQQYEVTSQAVLGRPACWSGAAEASKQEQSRSANVSFRSTLGVGPVQRIK
jgi:hypothetical protein